MRDPARIGPMLDALRAAWEANPDQRLSQLVLNATSTAGAPRDFGGAFNCEDDRLLAELTEIADTHAHRPVQHRDGKPPWCKTCGLDGHGNIPVSRYR